jgi:hypothetical protein
VVEVGVWKGDSLLALAENAKQLGLDAVVIAVDTWLGSWEHWVNDTWFQDLAVRQGRPHLQQIFMANIIAADLQDYVVPLPLDSLNAAELLRRRAIQVDLLHLDAGHSYQAVTSDLGSWWPLIREGGLLIGDDYSKFWPPVVRAFTDFFGAKDLLPLEVAGGKCRVVKPSAASEGIAPKNQGGP